MIWVVRDAIRRRITAALVLGLAVAVTISVTGCTGPGSSTAGGRVRSGVTEMALPTHEGFSGIASVAGRLVLSGNAHGPGCLQTTAAVDPSRLRLGPVEETPCDRPQFAGQQATANFSYDPTSSTETFSVATSSGHGRVTDGPVLATFAAPAGDHPVSTAADGWVWVWGTRASGGGAQVTQVSAKTGDVVETVALPGPDSGTPLIAADADGLWLSLPPNTGPNESPTPILFIPAGGRTVRVTDLPARAGWWIVAVGHQVWIDTLTDAGPTEAIWTATGSTGMLKPLGTVTFPAAAQGGDDVAVGGPHGLWTFDRSVGSDPSRCVLAQAVQVVRIVPGRPPRPVAAIKVPVTTCHALLPEPGAVVYRNGYLYAVDGGDLYKVRV
jgi:hypothetical protein